ncbi:MAG: hypothetical protein AAGB46_18070 [Verrucomicrobiota bacterium]
MKMTRRNFVKAGTASAVLGIANHSTPAFAAMANGAKDKFGGWTGKKFKATGFFRVEKEDRWWFVTPEGNAFLSFGINHLVPDLFKQDYHREEMQALLGIEDLSNYQLLAPALRKWYLQTCKDFGFNTAGVHNSLSLINQPKPELPYMQPIRFMDVPHWRTEVPDENFKDMFSEEFASECDRLAKRFTANAKDDPYLLGYSMTDCPLFTEEDLRERTDVIGGARRKSRIGFPRKLRNLGSESAGKRAYVKAVEELYEGRIGKFNETYGTRFGSFDALESAKDWRLHTELFNGNETRDNIEFLKICVDKYYQVTKDSIRKYDENHMFFGDKINANTNAMDTVLPVTEKHTDVVMYQMYAKFEVQEPGLERWSRVTDKPFLNGDSAFTMVTDDMLRPYGPVADSLEQRAEWTKEYMEKSFSLPHYVGWHYCGLIDATMKHPRKQARQHSGLVNQYGQPYGLLQKYIKNFTSEMYSIATRGA